METMTNPQPKKIATNNTFKLYYILIVILLGQDKLWMLYELPITSHLGNERDCGGNTTGRKRRLFVLFQPRLIIRGELARGNRPTKQRQRHMRIVQKPLSIPYEWQMNEVSRRLNTPFRLAKKYLAMVTFVKCNNLLFGYRQSSDNG